ncbi:PBSX family phage terminase large subunit [Actinosynnema mirum]|uniref:Phage terminase, large subunit, PBSX family n=1 Tax=Actinosynnema mirum (strain ATCC 29888 / DSM 43827 / JCM 3225 / NBRC 14064 / NCIMB 13271 / NRRL B-12336 / IMRU 3971 / 101) TaxID=446462 RepID=C6WBN4_ACTMD|nr:phage terminase large subunit PBSX family [Actinosynnema mirum]ACU35602.1 phage terminase, large subunit, PBSX family [Actinosynnema mirum DSM 43827]
MTILAAPPAPAADAALSVKQQDSILDAEHSLNIWEGSIRSGKTIASICTWMMFIRRAPRGPLAIIGKTRDSAYRNVIDVMAEMNPGAVVYTRGAPTIRVLGRLVHVFGANDAKAEGVLRGLTLAGAYVDEITLVPEAFWQQLMGRLSVAGAQLFGTTNPDSPMHWLRVDYLDREHTEPALGLRSFKFVLDDNPGIPEEKKRQYKAQFTGLWYRRFILGEWVGAEGSIYDMLDDALHCRTAPPRERWQAAWMAADYGTSNPTHAVMVVLAVDEQGVPGLYVVAEWEHDGRKKGSLADAVISKRLADWATGVLDGTGLVPTPVLDPSAASLRTQMRADGWPGLRSADNRVDVGLRNTASLFAGARLFVDKVACPVLWKQLLGYVWDPTALLKGIEQPLKINDHGCDALRYAIMAIRMIWRAWLPDLAAADDENARARAG